MPRNVKGECRNTGRTHFKEGHIPWSKGKTGLLSKETRKKMGAHRKGKPSIMKGKHHPEETRGRIAKKVSILMLGNTYTKGKPWSEARREAEKLRVRKKKRKPVILSNGKEYHPDWREIRKEIYKRDNYICQECGVQCHNGIKIQCHHIDVDIKNNDSLNLITLCAACHRRVHFSANDWIRKFRWTNVQKLKMEGREVAPLFKR